MDTYTKAMFGENARQVDINIITQQVEVKDSDKMLLIAQSSNFGQVPFLDHGKFAHHLIMADMVLRPHVIIGSNHMRGQGASGIITSAFSNIGEWIENGEILFDYKR